MEKVKLSLFAEDDLICRNPKEQHRKKQQQTVRINEFKVAGYTTNTKSHMFLYTKNEKFLKNFLNYSTYKSIKKNKNF